jgi:hypothetical protein
MLVALARKLGIALWRYVETGLVPDGMIVANANVRSPEQPSMEPMTI